MKAWMLLGILGIIAVAGLAGLATLLPNGPTGNAIAPPTHWVDGSERLITYQVLDAPAGNTPVRIRVHGDIVYKTVLVNGEPYELTGKDVDNQWLEEEGAIVLRLENGEHIVNAYSCQDTLTGWKCGCVNDNNCNNWMQRKIVVE